MLRCRLRLRVSQPDTALGRQACEARPEDAESEDLSRWVEARPTCAEPPALDDALDPKRCPVVLHGDEPEREGRVDLFAHKRVHRQQRVADRLDLLSGEYGEHIVVSDVDAELVAAPPAARVASETTS